MWSFVEGDPPLQNAPDFVRMCQLNGIIYLFYSDSRGHISQVPL